MCFTRVPLDDALKSARELHFQKIDLAIHAAGSHLTPSEVEADPVKVAQQLRATNLQISAIHLDVGECPAEAAKAQLKAVGRLARLTTTPLICVPAAPLGADFEAEVERLTEWSRITTGEGVILTVETHRHTITADPIGAAELCRRVPGLGLTLDPSHYLVGPHRPDDFDNLLKYVCHVRLRDTGATEEQFQVRVGQGQLEYGRLVNGLVRHKYNRVLTVDVRDTPTPTFPVEPEVRKLKYLLDSLV